MNVSHNNIFQTMREMKDKKDPARRIKPGNNLLIWILFAVIFIIFVVLIITLNLGEMIHF